MAMSPTAAPATPLRQRMQQDMLIRGLDAHTRQNYVRYVRRFAVFLGRSPDLATPMRSVATPPARKRRQLIHDHWCGLDATLPV